MSHVSVIIPTYNRAKLVTGAIDSVLAQTYADYEIIVVDDGSTDNTNEILQSYGDKIHAIYQSNKGVSAARNTGIRAAKGKWIAFLDSDDIWLPEKLSVQVEDVERYPDSVLHLVQPKMFRQHLKVPVNYFDHIGISNVLTNQLNVLEEPAVLQMTKSIAWTQCVMVKADFTKGGLLFDETLTLYEDFDFLIRFAFKGKWIVNTKILVEIRRLSDTGYLSRLRQDDSIQACKNLDYIFTKAEEADHLSSAEIKCIRRKLVFAKSSLVNELLKTGQNTAARGFARACIRKQPSLINMCKYALTFLHPSASSYIMRLLKRVH